MNKLFSVCLCFLILGSFLALLFLAGCESEPQSDPPVGSGLDTPVARIDNEFITVEELLHHPGSQEIVDELIFEKLVLKKSAEMGITVPDAVLLDQIEEYLDVQGQTRREMLEAQWAMGIDLESLLNVGRINMLQQEILEEMVEDPTAEDVVTFLETDAGKEYMEKKAEELEKPVEEITVEEVQDDVRTGLRSIRIKKVYEEGLLDELVREGYEVVNLLRAMVHEDTEGVAWIEGGSTEKGESGDGNEHLEAEES